MSCCGACGGQDLEKEKAAQKEPVEKNETPQAEQPSAASQGTVEQFDPSQK